MKKSTVLVCDLVILIILCASSAGLAQSPERSSNLQKSTTNQYSAIAFELIEAYQPPPRVSGLQQPQVLLPPGLRPEHLTERYRAAWEELLLALTTIPVDFRVANIADRIVQALDQVADARSVPVLAEAFKRTTRWDVDQSRDISLQKQILGILIQTCSADALEAILQSLDLADEKYGNQKPETVADGKTLREWAFSAMLQLDNPGKSHSQKARIEKSKKWHVLLQAYENPRLSPKNREFLSKAKSAKRSEDTGIP